jgi:hypothetical protein
MALVATFAKPPVDFARVQRGWAAACDDLRVVLSQVDDVREAFVVYRHLEALTRELMALTEQAAARCEDLMREA